MARIRTIKPEFNTSESVARLSRDSQLFMLKLFCECDDHGRVRWLPKKIAGDLYPMAEDVGAAEVEGWAAELEAEDIFFTYVSGGSTYGCFKNWAKHQRVDKPGKSSIPEPCEDGSDKVSLVSRETLAKVSRSDLGVRPRKGKKEKERECEGEPPPAVSLVSESAEVVDDVGLVMVHVNRVLSPRFTRAANEKFIKDRLKQGATVDQMCLVVDFKHEEWHRGEMRKNLHPECLFRANHWERYVIEAEEWHESGRPQAGAKNGRTNGTVADIAGQRLEKQLGPDWKEKIGMAGTQ